jgi:hypothetical protein
MIYSFGQGVDAGRHRERQELFETASAALVKVATGAPDKTVDHFTANHKEEKKSDPMVKRLDMLLELAAQSKSDQRHDSLKSAKIEGQDHPLAWVGLSSGQTFAQRYGHGIHGQAYSQ